MQLMLLKPDRAALDLPQNAWQWLDNRKKGLINHYFPAETVPCNHAENLLTSMIVGDSVAEDITSAYLQDGKCSMALLLDHLYPFVALSELNYMHQSLRRGSNTILRSYCGRTVGLGFSISATQTEVIALPEFRSFRVQSLISWLTALRIEGNWTEMYFNSAYIDYWRQRMTVNNLESDRTSTEEDFLFFFDRAVSFVRDSNNKLLDAGCADGRLFPVFKRFSWEISGVDISWEMLATFKEAGNSSISHGSLEQTNMPPETFSFVNAWGVFDCTNQNLALHHLLGRLKQGGVLLVSGKNDTYSSDDVLGMEAEIGAASKLFPNGFTDFEAFEKAISLYGGMLVEGYYGRMRGDLAKGRALTAKPDQFYEWAVIIRKDRATPQCPAEYTLSSPHSRLFRERYA